MAVCALNYFWVVKGVMEFAKCKSEVTNIYKSHACKKQRTHLLCSDVNLGIFLDWKYIWKW